MGNYLFTQPFFKKNGKAVAIYFLVAIVFWFVFLVIIPQLYMLDLSFRSNVPPLARGGPQDYYTMEHYQHFVFGSKQLRSTDLSQSSHETFQQGLLQHSQVSFEKN